ncbi:MAG: nitrous oxide reductase family maturation protein NosD [Terrimonas sp.]|nr:nitrous oxide reductase family maturation protein NosD [Terrimonas sp.]
MTRFYLLILSLVITSRVLSNTIRVGSNEKLKTIKQALLLAKSGDTVLVQYGIYREGSLTITKPLTLLGIGFPVLDGENKVENLVISGKDVTIRGFQFRDSRHSSSNDYAAIDIIDATNIRIDNNKIINAHFGIHIANSTYCTVSNNFIKGQAVSEQSAGNGIHIWKSDHATIENNHIQGHRDGIYFEFVTQSVIRKNTSENNIRYGLHFMFSHQDQYIGNIFRNNGTGVAVMYTRNVTMTGNHFEKNWGNSSYGILLKDITDSDLSGNQFTNNTIGIFMEGGNRIKVEKNIFKNNGWAMKIQANCSDNFINYNNFSNNTFDISTNGTMVLSDFSRNYWDKYEGYDINKDGFGDVPYHPVSLYAMVIEQNPSSVILLHSFMVTLLDKAEKAMPVLTPENLVDKQPLMKPIQL